MTDSVKTYLENRGAQCPVCGSTNLEPVSEPQRNSTNFWEEEIACEDCGSVWTDLYTLSGYIDLKVQNPDVPPGMREYMVTLLYPLDSDETYVNSALTHTSEDAIDAVRTMAMDANPELDKGDFLCVSCVHVEDGKIVVDV